MCFKFITDKLCKLLINRISRNLFLCFIMSSPCTYIITLLLLTRLGEADSVLSFVEDGVVRADEDISQNPLIRVRSGMRFAQTAHAKRRAAFAELANVLTRFQGEGFAADGEHDVGHRVQFGAIHGVHAELIFFGADPNVHTFDFGFGSDHHRRSAVGDGLEFGGDRMTVDDDFVDFELPIGLTRHGDVGQFAHVMLRVGTAQGELAAFFTTFAIATNPKSEYRFGAFAVLNQTSERRSDIFDRQLIVAETQDAVEFGVFESDTVFGGTFGENLIIDTQTSFFFASEANFVRLDFAFHLSGTVVKGIRILRLLASRRRSAVKFLVFRTSGINAFGAWNPSVRRTRVV